MNTENLDLKIMTGDETVGVQDWNHNWEKIDEFAKEVRRDSELIFEGKASGDFTLAENISEFKKIEVFVSFHDGMLLESSAFYEPEGLACNLSSNATGSGWMNMRNMRLRFGTGKNVVCESNYYAGYHNGAWSFNADEHQILYVVKILGSRH